MGQTNEQKWLEKFELLKEYVGKNGRLPGQNVVCSGANIGLWLRSQTSLYKNNKLTPDREVLLRSIGVDFERTKQNTDDEKWRRNYDLLCKYLSEFGYLPAYREQYEGQKIGKWLTEQKRNYKNKSLSSEREAKLRSVGVVFEKNQHDYIEDRWQRKLDLLCEYVSEVGCLPIYTDEYKGFKIGSWLHSQAANYRSGTLSSEREAKLRAAGIPLERTRKYKDAKPSLSCCESTPNVFERCWQEKFELLCEFVSENERLPVCKEKYKGVIIGNWLWKQKVRYKNGSLSSGQIEKLRSIGVALEKNKQDLNDDKWLKRFCLLKEFMKEHNRTPESYVVFKGDNIGAWYFAQKAAFKTGKLSPEREAKLRECGVELKKTANR